GAVHDLAGDLRPLIIGQHPVTGRSADRTMPHRAVEPALAERVVRLLEQAVEVPEVAMTVRAQRRFQFGRVTPARDQVRVGVLLVTARTVQVVDQLGHAAPARPDLADHRRICLRTSSAAWSRSWPRRMLSAAYGSRSPERWPVAFNFATA